MTYVLLAGGTLVGTALLWFACSRLEESTHRLAEHYGIPDAVKGSILLAVASSMPELVTALLAFPVHSDFELGLSAIIGSAIFNILVIPGISGLTKEELRYDIRLVYRDAQFYLTSVAVLLLAFAFALIYEPVPEPELAGELTRPLALIPLALYGVYLFLQHQEWQGEGSSPVDDSIEISESAWRDWGLLLLGLLLVIVGVEGLLRTAIWLGDTLGTPSFLWGATVVAAATSIPDALISVRGASRGEGDVSIGNVLGSNIFDLLVAVPVGVLIAGAAVVDFAVAAPLMGYLTLATVVLFTLLRTGLRLTRVESVSLLLLYAVYVGWLVLETLGVVDVLG